MPYPLPPPLKLIAYLSGLTVDVLVSGAVHVRVNAVLLPVIVRFVGAPIGPLALAGVANNSGKKAADAKTDNAANRRIHFWIDAVAIAVLPRRKIAFLRVYDIYKRVLASVPTL